MKKLKVIIGVLISFVFLVLAFRKVDVREIMQEIASANFIYLILTYVVGVAGLFIRSFRWRIFMETCPRRGEIPFFRYFEATAVGQMVNNIMPFRMGDFAQAFFLSYRENISRGAVFSTVVAERLTDIFPPFLVLILGSYFVFLPGQIDRGVVFLIVLPIFIFVFLFVKYQEFFMNLSKKVIPSRGIGVHIHKFIEQLHVGLGFIRDKKRLVKVAIYTVVLWAVYALGTYFCLTAFDIRIGYPAAVLVLGITAISVTIPSSPGYIGTWEYFALLALSIFGINKTLALSFAVVYHFIAWITVTSLGFVILLRSGVSLSNLEKAD
ncbi:MAG: lysylphosphatidylglycerol synthase transmembrane domain-containing protein [Elusimicrobiota bacterium]